METKERDLLLRALSERIPYQTALEPLDGSPAGILKCTDWEGHVWITGREKPYDVSEVRPLLRKFSDLPRSEVTEIFSKILASADTIVLPEDPGPDDWFFTDDGTPYCNDDRYSLFFAPDIIDNYLNTLRSHWIDTQDLIKKGLAIQVNPLNDPYRLGLPEDQVLEGPVVTNFSDHWMVLPLKK